MAVKREGGRASRILLAITIYGDGDGDGEEVAQLPDPLFLAHERTG